MKHLILTGFMGVGKSTVGPLVASQLKLPFVDSDQHFEKEFGLHSSSYIRRFGIRAFRKWEKQFLRKILNKQTLVLATGGGMVLQKINVNRMNNEGYVVWIDVPLPLLLARIKNTDSRPLLPTPLTLKHLREIFQERKDFYKKCHLKVSSTFEKPEKIANQICQHYKEAVTPFSEQGEREGEAPTALPLEGGDASPFK
ncbi:MAG: shikimate kinase [Deltaproteobacteria bacterium]|nr:shikimate kinase [Deltaproteobacteria bacterium]